MTVKEQAKRDARDIERQGHVRDGCEIGSIVRGVENYHGPKPKQELPDSWAYKIGKYQYSEMWLRYYALMRHINECTVLASDYANHMTGDSNLRVRNLALDQRLLWAHALMLKEAGKTVKKLERVLV